MSYSIEKMRELISLLEKNITGDGIQQTDIPQLVTFRASATSEKTPTLYEPAIVILGQGKKQCYLGNRRYEYGAGKYLTLFLPVPLEVEILEASVEKPALMAGIRVDLSKIAAMLLKMEQLKRPPTSVKVINNSGIFSDTLDDELLDPVIRLLKALDNSADQLMLSQAIVEEIYYRVICRDQTGRLQKLLQQRGAIQRVSKAVEHIHTNIDQVVSVDELATVVGMSTSRFHRNFKDIMHLSPLQYAKSVKLTKAQTLMQGGKNASEAAYLVGYNSPAQFSREYKRYFGYTPSATAISLQ